jgi:hypothetical protein
MAASIDHVEARLADRKYEFVRQRHRHFRRVQTVEDQGLIPLVTPLVDLPLSRQDPTRRTRERGAARQIDAERHRQVILLDIDGAVLGPTAERLKVAQEVAAEVGSASIMQLV